MLKTNAQLEVKLGQRVYQLNLPADAPLGEVFDALFQMRSYVLERINASQAADMPKEQEPVKSE